MNINNINNKSNPIGVFDSGIGGLSVLRQLVKIMPNEDFVYLGDTARVPWGNKSKETINDYSIQCTDFLMEHNVKLIVVACNTASSYAIPSVVTEAHGINVVEMIIPAAKAAFENSNTKRIGIVGTRATIRSNAYHNAILKHSTFDNAKIYSVSCPMFVPIVEEGLIKHESARLIAKEYLQPLIEAEIDTLVLGCTHYPFLSELIKELMPNVKLIDTGYYAAKEALKIIDNENISQGKENKGSIKMFLTDSPADFLEIAKGYLDFELPKPIKIELI